MGVFCLECDHFTKKFDSKQCWLPSLPSKADLCRRLSFDMLSNVFFQNLVWHEQAFIRREKLLLFQIETVLAVEIADGPDRLGHNMKSALVWNFGSFGQGCCVHCQRKLELEDGVQADRPLVPFGISIEWLELAGQCLVKAELPSNPR